MQTTDNQLRGASQTRAETLEQMQQRHAEERAAWAWRQPAFSKETMAADPWTVVYLPIPENLPVQFGSFTLQDARALVRDMMVAIEEPNDPISSIPSVDAFKLPLGPLVNRDSYTSGENFAAAKVRLAELDGRVQIAYSRWTGDPLGEAAGQSQSAGIGQAHR